jgi:hypothetical protein
MLLLATTILAAPASTPPQPGPGSHRQNGSTEYAQELKQQYLAPALDLIKRSLPLGALKGFRQVNLNLQGKKFVVNVPFMLTECTTVVSRTADILKCVDEKNQARLEVTRLPLQPGWVKELSTQLKDPKPKLSVLHLEKSKQTLGSYTEVTAKQKPPTKIDEMICKNLAAAYNVTPALTQAFNCRLTLSDDLAAGASSHRIFLQKDGEPDLYEFSIWFQDKAMAGYYNLIPMVTLHSLRHSP